MIRTVAAVWLTGMAAPALAQDAPMPTPEVELGAEFRLRAEGHDGLDWTDDPVEERVFLRAMPHVELRSGPIRGHVQLIAAGVTGFDLDPGPVDRTGVDILQAFAELRIPAGQGSSLTLAGGRSLVGFGSERLVGTRYGANVPRAFDGARLRLETERLAISAFRLRPVEPGPNDFDDARSREERLGGVYATRTIGPDHGIDIYILEHQDEAAKYQDGEGSEERRTYGLRYFGSADPWRWNWEAMLQRGRIGHAGIRAWSLASETSYTFPVPLRPTVRLRANIASGDRRPADGVIGTFDAIYPKAKYFGELSPVGPANVINLHGTLAGQPSAAVAVSLSASVYWRHRRTDGLYDIGGALVREGDLAAPRYVGSQIEAVAEWAPSSAWSFTASASIFRPGGFLARTGNSQYMTLVGIEANLTL